MKRIVPPELIALRKKDLREWVSWCIEVARQHSADPGITVVEDDEKFILTIKCGRGGKLIVKRGQMTVEEKGLNLIKSH